MSGGVPPNRPPGYGVGPGSDRTRQLNEPDAAERTERFAVPGFGADNVVEGDADVPKRRRLPWLLGGIGGVAVVGVLALIAAISGGQEPTTQAAAQRTVDTTSADPAPSSAPATSTAPTTSRKSAGTPSGPSATAVAQEFVNAANARDLAKAKSVVCPADAANMNVAQGGGSGSLSLGQVIQESPSRATANLVVTSVIQGQNRSVTLPFLMVRDGSGWKLCPSAGSTPGG